MSVIQFPPDSENLNIELQNVLDKYAVPWRTWTSTGLFETLAREVRASESVLHEINGALFREVFVVNIRVRYITREKTLYLFEDHVDFVDGTSRRRTALGSVNEKMLPGEEPRIAAQRGMKEELSLDFDFSQTPFHETVTDKVSSVYLGLNCRFHNNLFIIELSDHDFRPEGYIERASDKTTYFTWVDKEPDYQP
jgi:hypothetical protein